MTFFWVGYFEGMNKKFIFSALCGGLLSSAFAQGNEGHFYAELKGGLVFTAKLLGIKSKTAFAGGGELGYAYDNFRFGFELIYSKGKTKDFTVRGGRFAGHSAYCKNKTFGGLINVYYDYALTDVFKLYVGTGLGLAKAKAKAIVDNNFEASDSCTKLAYQLMVGFSYDINDRWTIKTGYRFFDMSSIPHSHIVEAGIRYNF